MKTSRYDFTRSSLRPGRPHSVGPSDGVRQSGARQPRVYAANATARGVNRENVNREEIAQGCLDQAGWAAKLGSPMYDALLRRLIAHAAFHGRDVKVL